MAGLLEGATLEFALVATRWKSPRLWAANGAGCGNPAVRVGISVTHSEPWHLNVSGTVCSSADGGFICSTARDGAETQVLTCLGLGD